MSAKICDETGACFSFQVLFWVNMAVLGACYGWFMVLSPGLDAGRPQEANRSRDESPEPIQFVLQVRWLGVIRHTSARFVPFSA